MNSAINKDRPVVSIVMSFYKEPLQWITSAIDSILNQSLKDIELIIISDNPEHIEALEFIRTKAQCDSRILLLENDSNIGLAKSLNRGLSHASGKYIARMDADDIAMPDRLQTQVEFLESNKDISLCSTDIHEIDQEGHIRRRNRYHRKLDIKNMYINNSICHPAVMFRSDLLESRTPLYNEDYRYAQDYELWQYLLLKGYRIETIPTPLLYYRRSKKQISHQNQRIQDECFRKAHRSLIINWLKNQGIINSDDSPTLHQLLETSSREFSRCTDEDKEILSHIIYVLYFSLGTEKWSYRLQYLMDRNLIFTHIRPILTYRLLFSKRRRRFRTGIDNL